MRGEGFIQQTRNLALAGLAAGTMLLGACSNDSEGRTPPSVELGDTGEGSATSEDLFNPFNPTAAELARFECTDKKNEKYGINISEYNGVDFVKQVLPAMIPVEIEKRDPDHREATNSLDSPFTVDLNNKEEVHAQLSADLCAKPALLAGTVDLITNGTLRDQIIGEHVPMLERFVGKTPDQISAMITNPHNEVSFPEGTSEAKIAQYKAENLAATKDREALAEFTVAVLSNLQKRGNFTNMQLHSDYALSKASYFDKESPAKFASADYTGDVFVYDLTIKGSDCVEYTIAFNTGAITNGHRDDGDKRPVLLVGDNSCEGTPPVTFKPKADNGPVSHQGTGGGEPVTGEPTPDNGQPNPVGGTVELPPTGTEAPTTTQQPANPNEEPVDTMPPTPAG